MSSTTGLVNQDLYQIQKIYPDSRRNHQFLTLPSTVKDLQDPAFVSRIKPRIDLYDRLIAVTDDNGINIDHWELDNNFDGFLCFLTTGGKPRIVECETPHTTYSHRGYVYSAFDWRDIEGTIFIKIRSLINRAGLEPYITLKGRTGFHPTQGMCCQGAAYGCTTYPRVNLIELFREVYHDNKIAKENKGQEVASFLDSYVGLKWAVYNYTINGTRQVINEMYICPSDHAEDMAYNWVPVLKRNDFAGANWAVGAKRCGALTDDYPLDWAGPRAIFSWHGFDKLIFKYASWREIDPKQQFRTGGHKGGKSPDLISCPPFQHFNPDTGLCEPDVE